MDMDSASLFRLLGDDARLRILRLLDAERLNVTGRGWAAWARALGHLLPPLVIADLGCGDGYLTVEASRFAKKVIAVDRSEAALARAREMAARLARRRGEGGKIEWHRGELEN